MTLPGTITKEVLPDTEEQAPAPLTASDRMIRLLDFMWAEMQAREGRAPNFYVHEFEMIAGARETKLSDFNPDRWVIYFRSEANAILRVFPAGSVPAEGAVEIENGRYAVIANTQTLMSFHNSGSSTAQVFAVAIGGGAEFEIGSI